MTSFASLKTLALASVLGLGLAGCSQGPGRISDGALIGGAGGALAGGLLTGNAGGAVVGGVAGAVVGDAIDANARRPSCYQDRYGRTICPR